MFFPKINEHEIKRQFRRNLNIYNLVTAGVIALREETDTLVDSELTESSALTTFMKAATTE
ncbi:hypothetical protein LOAG_06640 [Loa loa]|uniref:Uncharacterized protein n=1 Tax=Loa loa TaxID=7209 RepID=A0A1S0TY95_LOALO|nr:hypothetical protein LOAG_06640 [Loa loa]EFO21848.1 hypothetical protein LOAG_06640 [Loa loa]